MIREKPKLSAEKRKIIGRKVKNLRKIGILPANVYGKGVKSLAVQLELKSFLPVFQKVKETGVVELIIKGEEKKRPVLIHNVQSDPVSGLPLHVDFYQVDLKKKITAEVPIDIIGESPAVKEKLGILIQPLTQVEVEALPTNLPDKLEVDISGLKEVNDVITVEEIKPPDGVVILTPKKEVLVKIEALPEEEIAPVSETPAEKETEEEKPTEEKDNPS